MKALGRHGPSLSLALVSLPSLIPSPGIPVGSLFGSVAALICLALVLGRPVALPDSLGKRRLPRRLWIGMLDRMVPLAERLERRLQPRLRQITGRLGHRLVGAIGFVLAVLIVLPIPFGNTLPAIATICLALGLAQRDGMAVASGFALSLLALGASLLLALFGVELAATLWSWLDLDLF